MGKKQRKAERRDVFEDVMGGLQNALEIACGTATAGRIHHINHKLHMNYDIAADMMKISNRDATITENEDLRETNTFKGLTLYEDRYSGDTVRLEITNFGKDGWYANEDLVTFLLVTSFDIPELDARSMCKRFYEPRVVS